MSHSKNNQTNRAWTRKWENTDVTTFTKIFPSGYDDSILDFWKSQLAGSLERVADIGCGNGAITWLCHDILTAAGSKAPVTGIDAANIDPFRALGRQHDDYPNVKFIGNNPAEHLPFSDNSIDLVVSQFGIEYSDIEQSIPEVARILSNHGRIGFILHNQNSIIVREAADFIKDVREMLTKVKLHELALALLEIHRQNGFGDQLQTSEAYQDLQTEIAARVSVFNPKLQKHSQGSVLQQFFGALNHATNETVSLTFDEREAIVVNARESLVRVDQRQATLAAAALTPNRQARLVELIEAHGKTVTCVKTLRYKQQDNFGTVLTAE